VILVDAGPLVALIDADDRHHEDCVEILAAIREPLGTVWPAITEAMYLLADVPKGQAGVWQMLERGAVRLLALGDDDIPRMRQLMEKYADLPMDLADAALVRVADRDGVRTVFTLDRRDFAVYRLPGGRRLGLLPKAAG
jgi:predicted nucleic acid-binding protein